MKNPPVVVITGASSGIGRALALALHARGSVVYATARRPEAIADLAAQGLRTAALDVCDATSIDALVARLRADALVPDVLVNNAGYGQMGPLLDVDSAALRAQFETNVFGLMAVTRAIVPLMLPRRRGRIVNIGSVSGILVTPFAGAYCASKAAVHALSDALRMELAPLGIDVITVQPGAIQSEFAHAAAQHLHAGADSRYAAVRDGIEARAGASQQHATPTAEFAQQLADAVVAEHVPAILPLGNGSRLLPLLARWLPRRWRDRVLSRRFRLDRL